MNRKSTLGIEMVQAITAFKPEYGYKRGQHAGVSAFGVQKTDYGGNGQDIDLFKPIVIPENKDDTVQHL